MLYYLGTVIVIYAVEGNVDDQQRAINHLALFEQAGHRFAISELTHTECLAPAFGHGGAQRLSEFMRFFHGPNLRTLNDRARFCSKDQMMFARKWHCFSDDYEAVAHLITIEIAHGHLGLTASIHTRASIVRGGQTYPPVLSAQPRRYGLADALHLATAIEHGCDVFLTNDNQLANFPDIKVEVLP